MYGQSTDRVNPTAQHCSRDTHHLSPAELDSIYYRSSGRHSFTEQHIQHSASTQTEADNQVTQQLYPWQHALLTITSKNPRHATPNFIFSPATTSSVPPRPTAPPGQGELSCAAGWSKLGPAAARVPHQLMKWTVCFPAAPPETPQMGTVLPSICICTDFYL